MEHTTRSTSNQPASGAVEADAAARITPGDGVVVHHKPLTVVAAPSGDIGSAAQAIGDLVAQLIADRQLDFASVAAGLQQYVIDLQPRGVAAVLDIAPDPIAFLFDEAAAVGVAAVHRASGRAGWTTVFLDGASVTLVAGSGPDRPAQEWSSLWAGTVMGQGAGVALARSYDSTAAVEPDPAPPIVAASPVGPMAELDEWGGPVTPETRPLPTMGNGSPFDQTPPTPLTTNHYQAEPEPSIHDAGFDGLGIPASPDEALEQTTAMEVPTPDPTMAPEAQPTIEPLDASLGQVEVDNPWGATSDLPNSHPSPSADQPPMPPSGLASPPSPGQVTPPPTDLAAPPPSDLASRPPSDLTTPYPNHLDPGSPDPGRVDPSGVDPSGLDSGPAIAGVPPNPVENGVGADEGAEGRDEAPTSVWQRPVLGDGPISTPPSPLTNGLGDDPADGSDSEPPRRSLRDGLSTFLGRTRPDQPYTNGTPPSIGGEPSGGPTSGPPPHPGGPSSHLNGFPPLPNGLSPQPEGSPDQFPPPQTKPIAGPPPSPDGPPQRPGDAEGLQPPPAEPIAGPPPLPDDDLRSPGQDPTA